MKRLIRALLPTIAAFAWANRDQIKSWWTSRNAPRAPGGTITA